MDIQFHLDVLCVLSLTSQKGISEILQAACDEARKCNTIIKQKARSIGDKFLKNVKISSLEAVYIVLELPMRKSSHQVVFVNTSPHVGRVKLLKCLNDIKEMESDCEEIYSNVLLYRFTKRLAELEHLPLTDWAACV